MIRPPLGLSVEVTDASGALTQWTAQSNDPENRPRSLTFSSQRMQGFASASVDLARRIDRDYVDVHLLDDLKIVGDDGSIAWEGRVTGIPRSVDTSHSLNLQASGWMGHARDRKFTGIYVDRDLSQWQAGSRTEQIALAAAGYSNHEPSVVRDLTAPAVRLGFTGTWAAGGLPAGMMLYDAGADNTIGSIYYEWTRGVNVNNGDGNWDWRMYLMSSDNSGAAAFDNTGALRAAGPGTGTLTATTTTRRFVQAQLTYGVAGGTAGMEYALDWRNLAVYGKHSLTLRGTAPSGLYASDMLRHIFATYCPMLDTSGIQDTTYVIPHQVFRDPIDPYDAALDINKFHLWNLSVWENRTLHYDSVDLTDYDWDLRQTDPGFSASLQGDTSDGLANGIAVTFTDVASGRQNRLTPDDTTDLADASVENPANLHGYRVWTEYTISVPTTTDGATQIGRAALAEFNAPKAPGSLTIGPYVRDRAGHWQPYWKIRAGDRVAITSSTSLSDRPRLIAEVSHTQSAGGGGSASISVDAPPKKLDAVMDRISTALAAANLT